MKKSIFAFLISAILVAVIIAQPVPGPTIISKPGAIYASQAEVDAGLEAAKSVSPLTLAAYSLGQSTGGVTAATATNIAAYQTFLGTNAASNPVRTNDARDLHFSGIIKGNTNGNSINPVGRILYNALDDQVVTWDSGVLSSNAVRSVNWNQRKLFNTVNAQVLDWSGGTIAGDGSGLTNIPVAGLQLTGSGLIGRSSAGVGQQITIGSGLDFTGTTLSATAGGSATNAISRIETNGVAVLSSGATNINFVNGDSLSVTGGISGSTSIIGISANSTITRDSEWETIAKIVTVTGSDIVTNNRTGSLVISNITVIYGPSAISAGLTVHADEGVRVNNSNGVMQATINGSGITVASSGQFIGNGGGLTNIPVVASGFNGNLTTSDDTLQEVAQKVDDLPLGAGGSATNAVSRIETNGVAVLATGVTNINFVNGDSLSVTGGFSGSTVILGVNANSTLTRNTLAANINGASLYGITNLRTLLIPKIVSSNATTDLLIKQGDDASVENLYILFDYIDTQNGIITMGGSLQNASFVNNTDSFTNAGYARFNSFVIIDGDLTVAGTANYGVLNATQLVVLSPWGGELMTNVPIRALWGSGGTNTAATNGTAGQILTSAANGGVYWTTGGGGGAPTDADYLVGTANGGLSAEIVVGTSPGGELGGSWATPTIDDSVSVATWTMTGAPGITLANAATSAGVLRIDEDDNDGANYVEQTVAALAANRTITWRDAAGTPIISGDTFTGDVTATLDSDGGTLLTIADSVTVTTWELGASTATTPAANATNTSLATTAYVQTELTAYASDTVVFTGKTLDAAATGNVLKQIRSLKFTSSSFANIDGTGVTIVNTNDLSLNTFMTPQFGGNSVSNANYIRFMCRVPKDIDTSVAPTASLTVELTAADTGAQIYHVGYVTVANSAVLSTATPAVFTVITVAADASGASGDIESTNDIALNSWGPAANLWWIIELRRSGNESGDTSTVASRFRELEIFYTSLQ